MNLPHAKVREQYTDEIKVLEAAIRGVSQSDDKGEAFAILQKRLDNLAKKFQYDEAIGSARYKLYELQALIYFFKNDDQQAEAFIREAINAKGGSYPRAEQLLSKISEASQDVAAERYFYRSAATAAFFSFITGNLYLLYWAYKHWKMIQVSTGEKTHPVLSSIFQLFTTYSLFKRVKISATASGYSKFTKVKLAAAGYILLIFISNALARVEATNQADEIIAFSAAMLLSAVAAAIVFTVQKAANAHNVAVMKPQDTNKKLYVGEAIFILLGVILIGAYTLVVLNNVATNAYPQGTTYEISQAESRVNTLQSEYDTCSASLNAREAFVDTTSTFEVNQYNRQLEACEDTRFRLNNSIDEYNKLSGYN